LVSSNLGSFCRVSHLRFLLRQIPSIDKLVIERSLVFEVVRAKSVVVIRWFGVHHPAGRRIQAPFSSSLPWGIVDRNGILLKFDCRKSGMVDSLIIHLVVLADFVKFCLISLYISWLYKGRFMFDPRLLGLSVSGLLQMAVFDFEQEVFNLGVLGEETGFLYSQDFKRLARLRARNVSGS